MHRHLACIQTYKDATLEPGPRLNLVLGPNGELSLPKRIDETLYASCCLAVYQYNLCLDALVQVQGRVRLSVHSALVLRGVPL